MAVWRSEALLRGHILGDPIAVSCGILGRMVNGVKSAKGWGSRDQAYRNQGRTERRQDGRQLVMRNETRFMKKPTGPIAQQC